jgi:hypothetical protein
MHQLLYREYFMCFKISLIYQCVVIDADASIKNTSVHQLTAPIDA